MYSIKFKLNRLLNKPASKRFKNEKLLLNIELAALPEPLYLTSTVGKLCFLTGVLFGYQNK